MDLKASLLSVASRLDPRSLQQVDRGRTNGDLFLDETRERERERERETVYSVLVSCGIDCVLGRKVKSRRQQETLRVSALHVHGPSEHLFQREVPLSSDQTARKKNSVRWLSLVSVR